MPLPPREEFERGLRRRMDMDETDAGDVASIVYETFDGRERVSDLDVEKPVRSVFYTLETNGLLGCEKERYHNENGHLRREFFWYIKPLDEPHEQEPAEEESTVYDTLPRSTWTRSGAAA